MQNKTLNEEDPWYSFLAATAWAIRSTYHTTLRATLTQLVFGCDMILNIKFKADWAIINAQKQSRTEKILAIKMQSVYHTNIKLGIWY
jgi:hypothetical protein